MNTLTNPKRRNTMLAALALAGTIAAGPVLAADPIKVGLILPLSGPFTSTGKQIETAIKVFQEQHGDTVAGRKVEIVLKDDGGSAEVTKRLAQELVV
ncbi:MAG: ABC transporter substrate-binding protein, partial [Rhodocyclales bacterium]|nr:ABC transporter substrate-binding protein [Rhodocyclales bacterium]